MIFLLIINNSYINYKFEQMIKILSKILLFFCIIFLSAPQDVGSSNNQSTSTVTGQASDSFLNKIGDSIDGKIDKLNQGSNYYIFNVGTKQKKYIFLRILSRQLIANLSIEVFNYETGLQILNCKPISKDSCFLKSSQLRDNEKLLIQISGDNQAPYLLQTYWGDLQHLVAGQQLRFSFNSTNTSQLFHFQMEEDSQYEEVRVVLAPETFQSRFDNVKIYANYGNEKQPTEEVHDFESIRVWDDSEIIIIKKQELNNKNGLNIFVVGQSETIYTLKVELITKNYHDIQLNQQIKQYIQGKNSKIYKINFMTLFTGDISSLELSISIFTGQLNVQLYEDQELSIKYFKPSLQYMSDMKFFLTQYQFVNRNLSQLYLKVSCPDASTIYSIKLEASLSTVAHFIPENIYQFIAVRENPMILYYDYKIFDSNIQEIEGRMINVYTTVGQVNPLIKYYICYEDKNDSCLVQDKEELGSSATQVKPLSAQKIGSQFVNKIRIESSYFVKDTIENERRLRLVILVQNQKKGQEVIYSVTAFKITNSARIENLRDGRVISDKILKGQKKYYKYFTNNANLISIQLFFNQISGKTSLKTYRQDPRLLQNQQIQGSNKTYFAQNLTIPIYIEVEGQTNSVYSLSVSVLHPDHPYTSALTLSQDIQYTIKLQPFSMMNIEMHPINSQVTLEFNSQGGNILMCEIKSIYNLECKQGTDYTGEQGSLIIRANSENRVIRYRIMNYPVKLMNKTLNASEEERAIIPRKVKVRIIYHQINNKHCDIRKINKVQRQSLHPQNCLAFNIHEKGTLEIMMRYSLLDHISQAYKLCGSQITPSYSSGRGRKIINFKQMSKMCLNQNDMNLTIQFLSNTKEEFKLQYSVELSGDPVYLEDGLAYQGRDKSSGLETFKVFVYQIEHPNNSIEIYLQSLKGKQIFYADIKQKKNSYESPSALSTIISQKLDHTLSPRVIISSKQIADQKCQNQCVLIIGIASLEKSREQIQYSLTVTQNSINLRQGQTHSDFVGQHEFRYYEYKNTKAGNSLLIKISDNNQECAKIYLSQYQFPSAQTSFIQDLDGTVIYQNATKGKLYIGVQGLSDCIYSISIGESNSTLTKIQAGHYYDIQLQSNQTKFFIYRHYTKSSFKIISLIEHGNTHITAKPIPFNEIDFSGTPYMDQPYFKTIYSNVLSLNQSSPEFCSTCYYLIAVKADQKLEGSVIISSKHSRIKLTGYKTIFDQLIDQNETVIERYPVKASNLSMIVLAGSLDIELSYHGNDTCQKRLESSKKRQFLYCNFSAIPNDSDPILIKIKGIITPTLYSLNIVQDNTQSLVSIIPGKFEQFLLQPEQKTCVTGKIRDKKDEIIISQNNHGNGLNIRNIDYQFDIQGTKDEELFGENYYNNILTLQYKSKSIFFTKQLTYTLCLSAQTSQSVTIYQSAHLNILPPDTPVLITKQQKFLIHSEGTILMDLFQCSDKAQIKISTNTTDLDFAQNKVYSSDVFGIPEQSHAIRLSESDIIVLSLKSAEAKMVWMPIDYEKEEGIGYFVYSAGTVSYEVNLMDIQFVIGQIKQIKEIKTKINKLNYSIVISESREQLHRKINCQKLPAKARKQFNSLHIIDNPPSAADTSILVSKKQLNTIFGEQNFIYYSVVADLILETPSSKLEHYRIFYHEQEIPAIVYINSDIYSQLAVMSAIITGVLIIIAIFVCLFIRCLAPLLAKIRQRTWVVDEQSIERDHQTIPETASDRERGGTEQTMNN